MTTAFYLKDTKSKGPTSIYLQITLGKSATGVKNKAKIYTSFMVPPKNWNPEKQCMKRGSTDEAPINARLNEIRTIVSREWNRLLSENGDKPISLENLVDATKRQLKLGIAPTAANVDEDVLFEALERYIDSLSMDRTASTVTKYRTLYNLLQEYDEGLTFEMIDSNFYDAFKSFCIKEKKYINTTFNKSIKLLKSFVKWANERGYTRNDTAKTFKPLKQHSPNIFALSEYDLQQLRELPLFIPHLDRARDIFLFACLTGQRWSDYRRITRESIIGNNWNLNQKKTQTSISIPLIPEALKILDKYKNYPQPLPVISNQKANEYLKEIGKLLQWNDPIPHTTIKGAEETIVKHPKWMCLSTHVARKTFITRLVQNKIPIANIMYMSGHKSYSSIKPYIRAELNIGEIEAALSIKRS